MLFLKGHLVGAKLFLKASQGAVRTISLSTFSHEYHIRTSSQRTPEFDQSFGHLLSFRTPLMPDRLVSSLRECPYHCHPAQASININVIAVRIRMTAISIAELFLARVDIEGAKLV